MIEINEYFRLQYFDSKYRLYFLDLVYEDLYIDNVVEQETFYELYNDNILIEISKNEIFLKLVYKEYDSYSHTYVLNNTRFLFPSHNLSNYTYGELKHGYYVYGFDGLYIVNTITKKCLLVKHEYRHIKNYYIENNVNNILILFDMRNCFISLDKKCITYINLVDNSINHIELKKEFENNKFFQEKKLYFTFENNF